MGSLLQTSPFIFTKNSSYFKAQEEWSYIHAVVCYYFLFLKATNESLIVRITDINDNSPVFTKPMGYKFEVDEGKAGLTVGVVKVRACGIFEAKGYL